jgi:hypothetical protein
MKKNEHIFRGEILYDDIDVIGSHHDENNCLYCKIIIDNDFHIIEDIRHIFEDIRHIFEDIQRKL